MKALEAAEASSQLALEATQLGYRVGMRVNIDVLNAQAQLFRPRRIWPEPATTCSRQAAAAPGFGAAGAGLDQPR